MRQSGAMWALVSAMVFGFANIGGTKATTMLIDTHTHNADLQVFGNNFYTFAGSFPDLNSSWSMTDYAAATADLSTSDGTDAKVAGVILMELEKQTNDYASALAEASYYQSVANTCNADPDVCGGSKVMGLVASAPLELGFDATSHFLSTLVAAAPDTVGIRQGLWLKESSFFYDSSFLEGLSALADFDLPFDLLVEQDQLDDAAALAAAVPSVSFNLNHIGYPTMTNKTGGNWEMWVDGINKLAALPNVYCKLSGLPQSYDAPGWTAADFEPYVKVVLDAFGATRINFAGNWFVLTDEEWEGTYPSMLLAVTETLDNLGVSQADQEWIYSKSATQLYHLSDSL